MKSIELMKVMLVGFAAVAANAQTGSPMAQDLNAERQRIATERSAVERSLDAAKAACYQDFFVNSCLDGVNERRRAGLSELRRQEILLNDQERQTRAAEQLRKLDKKAALQNRQRDSGLKPVPALPADKASGARDTKPKQARDASPPRKPAKSGRPPGDDKNKRADADADAKSDRVTSETAQVRAFEERQKKAQERRLAHDQAQQNRSKPAARPLPPLP